MSLEKKKWRVLSQEHLQHEKHLELEQLAFQSFCHVA
jgi:hypothetical protein